MITVTVDDLFCPVTGLRTHHCCIYSRQTVWQILQFAGRVVVRALCLSLFLQWRSSLAFKSFVNRKPGKTNHALMLELPDYHWPQNSKI
jgi:hypothetical protein